MKHILKILLAALLLAPMAALHAAEPSFPDGIEHVRVERSDSERYQFLHDPAIEFHKGELFAAWYNCPEKEIVGAPSQSGNREPASLSAGCRHATSRPSPLPAHPLTRSKGRTPC